MLKINKTELFYHKHLLSKHDKIKNQENYKDLKELSYNKNELKGTKNESKN